MSLIFDSSNISVGEIGPVASTGRNFASAVTAATVLYNFLLCFVNTNLTGIGPSVVVSAEIAIIGLALGLVWYQSYILYSILVLFAVYFFAIMLARSEFDPKILRDLLIPIAFFFLGKCVGTREAADRLVSLLICVAFGAALFEWLTPDVYLHYFDVIGYYVARGTVSGVDAESAVVFGTGFFNSLRFDSRTLLPFLGDHRVSGIFLEAPSVGNFAAIVFAWILVRDRHSHWIFAVKLAIVGAIVVLADARFGLYFCVFTVLLYIATPYIRPTMLFIAPFLAILGLLTYAITSWNGIWDNTILGRFLYAGHILTTLDPWQVYGVVASNVKIGVSFAMNAVTDSGYAYALIKIGLFGMAGIWALFVYAPVPDKDTLFFRNFVAFYYIILLSISASVFTIKTAGLLWFLYGALHSAGQTDAKGTQISADEIRAASSGL
jgi:putative polymerase